MLLPCLRPGFIYLTGELPGKMGKALARGGRRGRFRGRLPVTFGGSIRCGRVRGTFQFALFLRLLFLLFLQLFAAFFAGVIWSGQGLFFGFLNRLGGGGRAFLLRCARGLALLLGFLLLVRLWRFVAHDAANSVAGPRCQKENAG